MTSPYLDLSKRTPEQAAADSAAGKDSRVLLWDDPETNNRCARCGAEKWPSLNKHCLGCRNYLRDGDYLIAEHYGDDT